MVTTSSKKYGTIYSVLFRYATPKQQLVID